MALWPYATRQKVRDDVVYYIEMFYIGTRLHSYLGYVSPNDYEEWLRLLISLSVFPYSRLLGMEQSYPFNSLTSIHRRLLALGLDRACLVSMVFIKTNGLFQGT
jgi:hypothetical protein